MFDLDLLSHEEVSGSGKRILHQWQPIASLSSQEREIDFAGNDSLLEAWRDFREQLKHTGGDELKNFTDRLVRSWSIETGIIERLYQLDEGTTRTLVEKGFFADYVDRASTDLSPEHLICVLNDQKDAAEFVYASAVHPEFRVTAFFLRQLHQILTFHQDFTEGMDDRGLIVKIPLQKGVFKTASNNPSRADGSVHQYAPPARVIDEVESLERKFHEIQSVHTLLQAAWLHHRFTQIHPFQDGNGRVARCLVTLVFLRDDRLPIVIGRRERTDYIDALEAADAGDVRDLARLFARLESNVLLEALSVAGTDESVPRGGDLVRSVAESIAARLNEKRLGNSQKSRSVNYVAEELLQIAARETESLLYEMGRVLGDSGVTVYDISLRDGHTGGPHLGARAHAYLNEIIGAHKASNYSISAGPGHYWVKRSIQSGESRLDFLVSLHHVGRQPTGAMAAACFAQTYFSQDTESSDHELFPCTVEPFSFTGRDQAQDLEPRFKLWLNQCLALAIAHWGETL